MSLRDDVKVYLRQTGELFRVEQDTLVDGALADMRRVGVPEALLDEDSPDPLVRMAVMTYAKGHAGYDVDEAPRFQESYRQLVHDILNSPSCYDADGAGTAGPEAESGGVDA